jgi:hypothetical protein
VTQAVEREYADRLGCPRCNRTEANSAAGWAKMERHFVDDHLHDAPPYLLTQVIAF